MTLSTLDWSIVIAFLAISLAIGIIASKKAGKSSSDFFLSGRSMPWWLIGISMVATTFSADTPNLVTDIVRRNGVSGNWVWWAFLLTGMLTVFVYSKLWRRTKALTDLEFYEIRYSGKPAQFLRGFRSIYLGLIFNILVMATVCLAAIKIGGILLGLSPFQTIFIASVVTVIYSSLGGLRGVIYTDILQFAIAMIGSVWACIEILHLPEVGGIANLLSHPNVEGKLNLIPDFSNTEMLIPLFILPLAIQWWSVWYPGSEPGGGGYVAQRMLAAKDEKNAVGATFLYNIAHYALRPWPWILIALASLVVVPMTLSEKDFDTVYVHEQAETVLQDIDLSKLDHWISANGNGNAEQLKVISPLVSEHRGSVQVRALAHLYNSGLPMQDALSKVNVFLSSPDLPLHKVGQDNAYSIMLKRLSPGLIGLVLASLIAAFMSTLSTHLNWGSSYLTNDFYHRFVKKDASQKELVNVGRISTVLLMVLAALFALVLENALDAFMIIVQIGAGTGLIFILRWFWGRINAYTEIGGMAISFVVAIVFKFNDFGLEPHWQMLAAVIITTAGWLLITFVTPREKEETLKRFNSLIRNENGELRQNLPLQILMMLLASIGVYSALFATGFFIYGNVPSGIVAFSVSALSFIFIFVKWKRALT